MPFALIALLWVGLGPPWEASAVDNQMRYVVLVSGAAVVAGGCIALKEALNVAGERFYSTLGFGAIILAGPLYLVGETILLAAYSAKARCRRIRSPNTVRDQISVCCSASLAEEL